MAVIGHDVTTLKDPRTLLQNVGDLPSFEKAGTLPDSHEGTFSFKDVLNKIGVELTPLQAPLTFQTSPASPDLLGAKKKSSITSFPQQGGEPMVLENPPTIKPIETVAVTDEKPQTIVVTHHQVPQETTQVIQATVSEFGEKEETSLVSTSVETENSLLEAPSIATPAYVNPPAVMIETPGIVSDLERAPIQNTSLEVAEESTQQAPLQTHSISPQPHITPADAAQEVLANQYLRAHVEALLPKASHPSNPVASTEAKDTPQVSLKESGAILPQPSAPLMGPVLFNLSGEQEETFGDSSRESSHPDIVIEGSDLNPTQLQASFQHGAPEAIQEVVKAPSLPTFEKLSEQIQEPLDAAIKAKENTIEITLNPEGLGHVKIELNFEGKTVRANFEAKDPSALSFLKHHEGRIQEIFAASGFSSDQNSLSFSLNQQQQQQQKQQHAPQQHPVYKNTLTASLNNQTTDPSVYNNDDGTFAVSI